MAELKQLPDVVDLSFVAGDTFRIRVRVIDPAEAEPLPLTDYIFAAQIALNYGAANTVAEFENAPDPDNPTTSIILTLPSSETMMLPSAGGSGTEFKGVWDLEVRFPNDDVRTVAKGTVTCVLDVTNTGQP